jgi:hypothetical protein
MSDYHYDDPPRRPLWPMLLAFGTVGALVLLCSGVAFFASGTGRSGPGGQDDGNAPAASNLSESAAHQAVKDYILDNANDAKSVEFQRWGPDDLDGQLRGLLAAFKNVDQIVRVRFREKNEKGAFVLQDLLAYIQDGKVILTPTNKMGDNWIEIFKSQAPKPKT